MVDGWQAVQRKILPPPCQRFFGEIDIESSRSDVSGANGKGARIGKTIQKPPWSNVTHTAPVFSLINKESHGIAHPEVDPKFEMPLGGDCLQILGWIAKDQTRRFALFVFAGDEPGENTSNVEPDGPRPGLQLLD